MTEFDIITQYFATQGLQRADVRIGMGDDAAIVQPPPGCELAMTTDTLIEGVHFPKATEPFDIGYKSLAVNLSDLAAMGAEAAWVMLSITLPHEDPKWLHAFCEGFFTLANQYGVQLIGGDLTRGDLSITVQAIGFTPSKTAILRAGAKPNDLIYVTGNLGDAGLALQSLQNPMQLSAEDQAAVLLKLNRPEPRLEIGQRLRNLANAAIDISDGLAADLGHILEMSRVGASINVDALPLSATMKKLPDPHQAIEFALTAGDDYELCFTVPADKKSQLEQVLSSQACRFTCIGHITEAPGLTLNDQHGNPYHGKILGYQHF